MKAASTTVKTPATPPAVEVPEQTRIVLTVELLLYAGIFSVAAVLRLWNLAASPLATHEAAQAVAAFDGAAMPLGGSPLLFGLNQLLFGLFGTTVNDGGVRLVPALLGTIMVALPLLFRSAIGRYGALAAALLLALSPTLVAASRSLDGVIVTATCTLAAIGFGLRYFTTQKRIDRLGLAGSIGVGLTSGPGLITLGIVLIPALLIIYLWIALDEDRARLKQLWQEVTARREAVLVGGVALLLAATTLLLRPAGLSGVPEILSAWLSAWTRPAEISALHLFQILIVYEPLLLCFGLLGLFVSLRRLTGLVALLSVWAIGALIVASLQPGRQGLDLSLVLTPLALLGGLVIDRLARDLEQQGAWRAEGVFWIIAAVVLGFAAINAGRTATELSPAQLFLGMEITQATSLTLGMLLLAGVIFLICIMLIGWRATLRAAGVTLLAALAVTTFSSAWHLTQVRPANPRELLWGPTTTTLDVRLLREAVQAASRRRTGFLDVAPVAVTLPQDNVVLRWYLRDFKQAQYNAVVSELAPVIVAPQGSTFPPFVTDTYQGQPFVTQTLWEPSQLSAEDFLRWWLYRESNNAPRPVQTYVVWVKINP